MFYRATMATMFLVQRPALLGTQLQTRRVVSGSWQARQVSGNRARPMLLLRCETGLTGVMGLFTAIGKTAGNPRVETTVVWVSIPVRTECV